MPLQKPRRQSAWTPGWPTHGSRLGKAQRLMGCQQPGQDHADAEGDEATACDQVQAAALGQFAAVWEAVTALAEACDALGEVTAVERPADWYEAAA